MKIIASTLKIVGLALGIVMLAVGIAASSSAALADSNRVLPGVVAYGKDLRGFDRDMLTDFLESVAAERMPKDSVILTCGEQRWQFSPAELHIKANVEECVEEALGIGRGGTFVENLREQVFCYTYGHTVTLSAVFDETALATKLDGIAQELHRDPFNAFVTLDSLGNIYKTGGIIGKELKTEPIIEALTPKITALKLPTELEIAPDDVPPYVSDTDISAIDGILAAYTTTFVPGDRGDNIAIAASHLNGVLIRSNAVFSFNNAVGQRTRDAGYKDAGVFIDGRLEQDVGGGVCQVSSTLYNAILLAGLNSVVRTAHYYPSLYCPPGRDATVADGLLDFCFQNIYPHNVYLQSAVSGDTLTIYVLGTWADLNGNIITLENDGTELNPSVWRIYSQNGQVMAREFLHSDSYSNPKEMEQVDNAPQN